MTRGRVRGAFRHENRNVPALLVIRVPSVPGWALPLLTVRADCRRFPNALEAAIASVLQARNFHSRPIQHGCRKNTTFGLALVTGQYVSPISSKTLQSVCA